MFIDKQTGKETLYHKQILNFKPPQAIFVAETTPNHYAYFIALQ